MNTNQPSPLPGMTHTSAHKAHQVRPFIQQRPLYPIPQQDSGSHSRVVEISAMVAERQACIPASSVSTARPDPATAGATLKSATWSAPTSTKALARLVSRHVMKPNIHGPLRAKQPLGRPASTRPRLQTLTERQQPAEVMQGKNLNARPLAVTPNPHIHGLRYMLPAPYALGSSSIRLREHLGRHKP